MIRITGINTIINNVLINRFNVTCRLFTTSSTVKESAVKSYCDVDKDMPVEIENPFVRDKEQCILCKLKIDPDYKNVRLLSQFQSRHTGRLYDRNITGLCKAKHEKVELEMTKAQLSGLMGYSTKNPRFVSDPPLFNPNRPIRPHNY